MAKGTTDRVVERVVEPMYKPRPMSHKKIGREPNLDVDKAIRFVSDVKNATVYKKNADFIVFSNHIYVTDNLGDIELIRKSSLFNNGIWENEFPPSVVKKFAEDKKHLTRINEETLLVSETGL